MDATPRIHVVTGKGGVGKSTVAGALALAASAYGEVLAVELAQPGGLCRVFDARPVRPSQPVLVAPNLSLMYVDGAFALAEYLSNMVRVRRLLDAVLDHPLYRAFVDAAPGVRELLALGKVMDEARQRRGARPRWFTVVLDAGASGHALEHLRMPAAAVHTFARGRVDWEARRLARELEDARYTALHVVATPETMPLNEAAEIIEFAVTELHMAIASLLFNRCRDLPPPGVVDVLGRLAHGAPDGLAAERRDQLLVVANRALARVAAQERGIAEVEARVSARGTRLPALAGAADERQRSADLVPHVRHLVAPPEGSP